MAKQPISSEATSSSGALQIDPDNWFGESTLEHQSGMLGIAQMLELDEVTQVAIRHLDLEESSSKLTNRLGAEVTQLILGFKALELTREKAAHGQVESIRKMLLAFSQDLRVVFIYLASRLQTLRWVTQKEIVPEIAWAQEILEIDAALANRLGIWQMKWELEDLAFRIVNAAEYQEIASLLDNKRSLRQSFITEMVSILEAQLVASGVLGSVYGRPKHIYSIWRKMAGKSLSFANLYDVSALRVLVADVKDCYAVLGLVHHIWRPVPREFDDYIARPKPNGYQSLHTVVMNADDIPLEIQIRTQEMHQQAEYGVAAHWRYKEAAPSTASSAAKQYEERIAWARQLIAWKEDAWEQLKSQKIDEQVYVMTPLGRVVALEKDSTPLDFAYAVHTNLGHRCRGARVNGAMVTLDTRLQNGQTVEVIAVKEGGPSRDWLMPEKSYLVSHRARSKVRAWFNAQDAELEPIKELRPIKEDIKEDLPEPSFLLKPSKRKTDAGDILVVGVDSLMTQLSKCCRPVPPDEISGFITRGRGVSIHRRDCSTLKQLAQRAGERIIRTNWGQSSDSKALFSAEIQLEALDRQGLLRDISEVFAKLKINVIGVKTLSSRGLASMQFSIEVPHISQIKLALTALEDVKGVTGARRK